MVGVRIIIWTGNFKSQYKYGYRLYSVKYYLKMIENGGVGSIPAQYIAFLISIVNVNMSQMEERRIESLHFNLQRT